MNIYKIKWSSYDPSQSVRPIIDLAPGKNALEAIEKFIEKYPEHDHIVDVELFETIEEKLNESISN